MIVILECFISCCLLWLNVQKSTQVLLLDKALNETNTSQLNWFSVKRVNKKKPLMIEFIMCRGKQSFPQVVESEYTDWGVLIYIESFSFIPSSGNDVHRLHVMKVSREFEDLRRQIVLNTSHLGSGHCKFHFKQSLLIKSIQYVIEAPRNKAKNTLS